MGLPRKQTGNNYIRTNETIETHSSRKHLVTCDTEKSFHEHNTFVQEKGTKIGKKIMHYITF